MSSAPALRSSGLDIESVENRCPRVVLEGCNGAWAQKHYLPTLAKRAAKDEIELWAIDLKEKPRLNRRIRSTWTIAEKRGRAHYLRRLKDEIGTTLSDVDFVFIVTPPRSHSQIAQLWLDRLSSRGKIFIEKPLDDSIETACKLMEKVKDKKNVVLGFDHYLAEAYPFLRNKDTYLQDVGTLKRIRFRILEPFGIPKSRIRTLSGGVTLDLFCHVLALVAAVLDKGSAPSQSVLEEVELEDVRAARYIHCKIRAETLSRIRFSIHGIPVDSVVGKGIGKKENKRMVLYGSTGRIELNFKLRKFTLYDLKGHRKESLRLQESHVESFLNGVIESDLTHSPGVLSIDAAFEILRLLSNARSEIRERSKIHEVARYRFGSKMRNILKRM